MKRSAPLSRGVGPKRTTHSDSSLGLHERGLSWDVGTGVFAGLHGPVTVGFGEQKTARQCANTPGPATRSWP
jgi:hypothetical protein